MDETGWLVISEREAAMASYSEWLDNLPITVNKSGVRLDLRFYIYPDGHGNMVFPGPSGNQPVNNVEEAVAVLRDLWQRGAEAHTKTSVDGSKD